MGELLLQQPIFLFEANEVEGVVDDQNHLFQRKRLFEKVEGAEFGGLHRRFDGAVARHDHDLHLGIIPFDDLERLDAVDAGQPDVEQDQVGELLFDDLEGFFAAADRKDPVTLIGQDSRQAPAYAFFIINNEYRFVDHNVLQGSGVGH